MSWELDEEHEDFRASVRAFVDQQVRPLVDAAEARGAVPRRALEGARRGRAARACVTPEELGGADGDALAVALLAEELGPRQRRHRGHRAGQRLHGRRRTSSGTAPPAQQERWLARAGRRRGRRRDRGHRAAAPAPTSPGITSTAAPRPATAGCSTAARCSSPTPGWPTCSSSPPAPADAGHGGVTLFLVEQGTPGLSLGDAAAEDGLALLRHPRGAARRRRGRRPTRCSARSDRGFYQIMDGVPARARSRWPRWASGTPPSAWTWRASTPASARRSARRSAHLQTIRHRLAAMEIELEAARLVTYQAAARLDAGHPDAGRSVARAKYLAAIAANRIVDDAVQLFGGAGFVEESPSPGTTATPGSCASAAAPTRSSWRS